MTESTYTIHIDTGVKHAPRPTNRWSQDANGFWREIYTDSVVMNADGTERSRKPHVSLCGLQGEDVQASILRSGGTVVAKRPGDRS
jgi:hypothetical protein